MKNTTTVFILVLLIWSSLFFHVRADKHQAAIIPEPQSIKMQQGKLELRKFTTVYVDQRFQPEVKTAFITFRDVLKKAAGIDLIITGHEKAKIELIKCIYNKQLDKEGYTLKITKSGIVIEASESAGIFYALQSIRQLLPESIEYKTVQQGVQWTLPCCEIKDRPRYPYRGMHLDVCRHFSPVNEVKAYLDELAQLKINRFHWHLTDDEGWRIEIKKYPLLTEVGGFRNRTLSGRYDANPRKWDYTRKGGFYTQEEIKDVIAYAKERFIQVIPEIEMPGHAVAALTAYPQYSCSGGPFEVEGLWGVFNDVYCTREETFTFLQDILDEVMELFPSEYIHIGGDECPKLRWSRCHVCQERMKANNLKDEHELQSYFIKRIGAHVNAKGKKFIGWDEILEGGLASTATVMSWQGEAGGIAAAKQGNDVIMTPNGYLYLDYYQSNQSSEQLAIGGYVPIEKVYSFNPTPAVLTPEQAKHITGVQGNLWTEYLITRANREYMIFPRIAAVAEIAWLEPDKKDYTRFKKSLLPFFNRLSIKGINFSKAIFYITCETVADHNQILLQLNCAYPDMSRRYTTDGTKPDANSTLYTKPIPVGKDEITISAVGVLNGKPVSEPLIKKIIKNKAAGQAITLSCEPAPRYKGEGAFSLANCITGQMPFQNNQWLGFKGDNVEIIVEFDKPTQVENICLNILHDPGSWIWAPASIVYYTSENGTDFTIVNTVMMDDIIKNKSKAAVSPKTVRKVKVVAQNYGTIPQGKPGAGTPAWLFMDEVIVQ